VSRDGTNIFVSSLARRDFDQEPDHQGIANVIFLSML
jgi:hypothetical protein